METSQRTDEFVEHDRGSALIKQEDKRSKMTGRNRTITTNTTDNTELKQDRRDPADEHPRPPA